MLISCPECRKQVSDQAGSCPHCGFKIVPKPVAMVACTQCQTQMRADAKHCPKCGRVPGKSRVGLTAFASVIALTVLALLLNLGGRSTDGPTQVVTTEAAPAPPALDDRLAAAGEKLSVAEPPPAEPPLPEPPPAEPPSPWSYQEQASAMDDAKTKIACTSSTNQVTLDFPYKNTGASLCIRRSPKFGLDAFVTLDGEGQILCRTYDGCTVRVRFDARPARAFPGVDAADHSTNIVFIKSVPKLIAELRKSDKATVELEFYQNGVQSLEFDTQQFEWK
jgi:hypothetical protein